MALVQNALLAKLDAVKPAYDVALCASGTAVLAKGPSITVSE